jgi:hypothetical protein
LMMWLRHAYVDRLNPLSPPQRNSEPSALYTARSKS